MGLTQQEALDLFRSDDLIGIGMAAMEMRRKKRTLAWRLIRSIAHQLHEFLHRILLVLRILSPARLEGRLSAFV